MNHIENEYTTMKRNEILTSRPELRTTHELLNEISPRVWTPASENRGDYPMIASSRTCNITENVCAKGRVVNAVAREATATE